MIFGTFTSESGTFCHIGGIVHSFTPSADNIIEGGIDAPDGHTDEIRHYDHAIRTLFVPEGVKGFAKEFLMGWAVTQEAAFPDTLTAIGTDDAYNVFSGCFLPEIILPPSVKEIGCFAFGHSYIKKLVVSRANKSKYKRQFKDSTIEKLYLPKDILESGKATIDNESYGFYANFHIHCKCNIIAY